MSLHSHFSSWIPARVTPLLAITGIVQVSAVIASMSALYGLASVYGGWPAQTAFLFPACLDLYWIAALGMALEAPSPGARRWAIAHAATAFCLSGAGQLLYHEMHAGEIRLGHSVAALLIAIIAIIPLGTAGALIHLTRLHHAAGQPARKKVTAPPRQPRTAPAASGTVTADHATTAPARATEPEPASEPAMPETAPGTEAQPRPLKPGGRPDPIAIEAAREEWHRALAAGQILNDRTLERAVNDRFGCKVIGRTSAGSVIAAEREQRRTG